MPNNTTTLAQLITRVRQRADMVGSTFVSDSEVVDYINVAMAEIHDLLVDKYEDYFVSSTTYTLPADNPGTLPSDFYKALGVDFLSGGLTYRMMRFTFQERNMYNAPAIVASRIADTRYAIQGNQIKFIPSPSTSGTVTLFYVPESQQFSAGSTSDTIVSKAPPIAKGYEEYLVVDAAIKCLMKEESNTQPHMIYKEQLRKRLEAASANRDAGESSKITDVRTGVYLDDHINYKSY
jgi:hypothetical protein|tara:strand:- start:125 stop:832 length:708 start_codon:yes stop_codon:yes gene_type:complete